jgi:hypothetical protein
MYGASSIFKEVACAFAALQFDGGRLIRDMALNMLSGKSGTEPIFLETGNLLHAQLGLAEAAHCAAVQALE